MLSPTTSRGMLGLFLRGADPPATDQRATTQPVRSPTSFYLQAILVARDGGGGARGGVGGCRSSRDGRGGGGEGGRVTKQGRTGKDVQYRGGGAREDTGDSYDGNINRNAETNIQPAGAHKIQRNRGEVPHVI